MLQWRVVDEKGNKVKSQEVLEMPNWCIHPFSEFSHTVSTYFANHLTCVLSEMERPLHHLRAACCRPILPGVPHDDRFLGGAHRLRDSMVFV